MQKSMLLYICGLGVAFSSLIFDSTLYCSCDSLTVTECSIFTSTCKIDGTSCTAIIHSDSPQCGEYNYYTCQDNPYECKWDLNSFYCKDSPIICTDYKTKESCPCEWNLDGECEEFSKCENYTREKCPGSEFGCEQSSNGCVAVICSNKLDKEHCNHFPSLYSDCDWNDKNQCVQLPLQNSHLYSFQTVTCPDFNDFEKRCTHSDLIGYYCKYSTNKTCDYKTCSDFSITFCIKAYISRTEFVLCQVVNEICTEMTDVFKHHDQVLQQNSYQFFGNRIKCYKITSQVNLHQA